MSDKLMVRLVEAMERSAKAQEDLIVLATEERDSGESIFGPPLCPHCGMFNPNVRSEGGDGPMIEYALVARCGNCGEMVYAVPQGWFCFKTRDEAREAIEGRKR
jgi:hypothetical protein